MYSPKAPSPFKFLDSYTKTDREIFFGRDREIEELYSKVFQSKIMLVYGASGTGKSSIINCGLANKFKDSDWLPIHIRRGGNMLRSMYQQIKNEAITPVTRVNESKIEKDDIRRAVNSVYLDHFKPLYLIFDQFEELFIFGMKEEWQEFINTVKFLIETDLEVRFIFVIRGEYLEFLSEFEEFIPHFFDNRVRIEKMTRNEAMNSINGPCELFSIGLEEGFEERLLKKLSPEKSEIELTFLQVFLDKVYKNAIQKSEGTEALKFTNSEIDEIGQIGDVLAEFLDEQLFKLEDSKGGLTVLKAFVSMEGTKRSQNQEEVSDFCSNLGYPLNEEQITSILLSFVNKRILKDPDESGSYELRHDSLALKIYEKITHQEKELIDVRQFLQYSLNEYEKRGTLLKDEDISYLAPFERILQLDKTTESFIEISKKKSNKRRKANQTRTVVFVIIVVLLITSVLGFINSQQQKAEAERLAIVASDESQRAVEQSIIATEQKEIADQQRSLALMNADSAAAAARIAQQNRILADQQRSEAERQRRLAISNFNTAEEQRTLAEKNADEALVQEKRALDNLSLAEIEREKALRLRMLSLSQSMGVKSTQLFDPELKGLLATTAYMFNMEFEGNPYQPDIYSALYNSVKAIKGDTFNYSKVRTGVSEILTRNDRYFFRGTAGNIDELKLSGNQWVAEKRFSSTEIITSFDISASGDWGVMGTKDGILKMFTISDGQELWSKALHNDEVSEVIIINNSIYSSGLDGVLLEVDREGKELQKYTQQTGITDFNIDNDLLFVSLDNGKVVRRTINGIDSGELPVSVGQAPVKLQLTENYIILGYESGLVTLLDKSGGLVKNLFGHKAQITDIKVNEELGFLVTTSYDRSALVWKLDQLDEQPVNLNDHDNWVLSAGFLPDSKMITSEFDGTIKMYELNPDKWASQLCDLIDRTMTPTEWNEFVAPDIEIKNLCNEK